MHSWSSQRVFQNAWVVADLDRAIETWAGRYGIGPFFAVEFAGGPALRYRGAPGVLDMTVAWAQAGDVQIELIAPHSAEPNVYRDLIAPGCTGFHHICFWCEDIEADKATLAADGFPLAMDSGADGGARFAYFDTSEENGHMIELLQADEGMAALFAGIAAAAASWDGQRPRRSLSELSP
ncbi:MAG: VOC family protein [Pseudomonadota bacterium]